MSKYSFFLLLFLLLFNCKNREPRTVNVAFHHWKSALNLSDSEIHYCQNITANTLYLRLFDVDYTAQNKFAEPLAVLNLKTNELTDFKTIIPTVFITNRTLININDTKIDSLTTLIVNKIGQITEGSVFKNKINDILIDCDWTATTKDKFFHLITQLKTLSDKKITVTIRLHQIKFKDKTGIPPADKGLLMAYNTGDLTDPKTINSILDVGVLTSYLTYLDKYPLQLDVALPIFSWGIVKRDGQAVQLIPNFSKAFLLKDNQNTDLSDGYREEVLFREKSIQEIDILKNGYFSGIYLYADDVIKIEAVKLNDLQNAATLLNQHVNNQQLTISFFSLDAGNINRYTPNDLLDITHRFK